MENQLQLILIEDLGYLYPKETSNRKRRFGLYKCHCGKEFKTTIEKANNGHTRSCGCLVKKHGFKKHRLYSIWSNIKTRCYNKKYSQYKDYGGRGIKVCEDWLNIENFINDMYPTFEEGLTLDRIDVNGNYCKGNCRWTTNEVQSRNVRKRKDNSTGYKGVYFRKDNNKYVSCIRVGKQIYLGQFDIPLEAALVYDKYVIDNNLEHTLNFKL